MKRDDVSVEVCIILRLMIAASVKLVHLIYGQVRSPMC